MRTPDYAAITWDQLADQRGTEVQRFDPETTRDLPAPARRLLLRALPPRTLLKPTVDLEMTGEIKLGPIWMPFEASQILHAGLGFVWRPIVGGRIVRFSGADSLGPDGARMEFRLHGKIPIVKASGPQVDKSAAGRLAAETVAWLPQALTPQAGATWAPIDDVSASVAIATPSGPIDVEVLVDEDGRLKSMKLQRWNESADPPQHEAFGGAVLSEYTTCVGVRIAGSGIVGWHWDTDDQDDGIFFRYTIGPRHQPAKQEARLRGLVAQKIEIPYAERGSQNWLPGVTGLAKTPKVCSQ